MVQFLAQSVFTWGKVGKKKKKGKIKYCSDHVVLSYYLKLLWLTHNWNAEGVSCRTRMKTLYVTLMLIDHVSSETVLISRGFCVSCGTLVRMNLLPGVYSVLSLLPPLKQYDFENQMDRACLTIIPRRFSSNLGMIHIRTVPFLTNSAAPHSIFKSCSSPLMFLTASNGRMLQYTGLC